MSDKIFDERYAGVTNETKAPTSPSTVKTLLKTPIDQADLERYGTTKPRRVQIRAVLIRDAENES